MATKSKTKQTGTTAPPKAEQHLDLPTQARLGPAVVKYHGDKLSEAFRHQAG
jgi:hypothetical protein